MAIQSYNVAISMAVINSSGVQVYENTFVDTLHPPAYCYGDVQMMQIHLECLARVSALARFRKKLTKEYESFPTKTLESLMDCKWAIALTNIRLLEKA
jgi:hypothetical protein